MLDLGPITNLVKSVQPPPQAQPSVAEAMKPVPDTEIHTPVPPPPAKGGEPGLGEHLDFYDTETQRPESQTKETETQPVIPDDASTFQVQAQLFERAKLDLLGKGTGLPQPTTDPMHLDLPFLKPLGQSPPGQPPLGQSIDARI